MVQCLSTSLLIVALPAKINEEDLRKMNLVAGFEALDYHEEFTSNDEPDDTYTWVTVNDTKMATKIVYDLLTGVFKKKLESARFVITCVEDDTEAAKYNSAGVFWGEAKGRDKENSLIIESPRLFKKHSSFLVPMFRRIVAADSGKSSGGLLVLSVR